MTDPSAAWRQAVREGEYLRWGAVTVPWTAAWTSEQSRESCYIRTERLDGRPLRFLCDGIDTPGAGKPMFAILHNERSREVVRRRLCQICRRDLVGGGICMNQGEREGIYPLINDGMPMCDPCAAMAVAQCPGLQRALSANRLKVYRARDWLHAPVLIGALPESQGGNPYVNALLAKERGPVFSGIKLALTRFSSVNPAMLSARPAIVPAQEV